VTELDERQQKLLASLPRHQRRARWFGGALTLVGLAYLGFALADFDPQRSPGDAAAFDAALTQPIRVHFAATEDLLQRIEPQSFAEWSLSVWFGAQARTSGALLVLAYRGWLGTLCTLLGFAILTVTVERARLLRLVERPVPRDESVGRGGRPE